MVSGCGGRSTAIVDSDTTVEADELALLDDMEPDGVDDREFFSWSDGYVGHWWSPASKHDVVEAVVPPREGSTSACHLAAVGEAPLSAMLLFPNIPSVDLDEYRALVFHARLQNTSGRLVVGVTNDDGRFRSPGFPVSTEWERVKLSFDELSPAWNGRAMSIDFIAGEEGEPFDLWIDDVWFVCRGQCPAYDGE